MASGLFDYIEQTLPAEETLSGPQRVGPAGPPTQRRDLFAWIDAIWNKSRPEGTPPIRLMHAFLASDPDMAQMAQQLQVEVREAPLIFRIWQGYLPQGKSAPRGLAYIRAKKPPEEEKLISRMKVVLGERRDVVERMVMLIETTGHLDELYAYYGEEAPDA